VLQLAGCGTKETISTSFSVSGPCSACPPTRLQTELQRLDNIEEVYYNANTGDLVVKYIPGTFSRGQLREMILDLGYSVDGEYPLVSTLATCCDPGRGLDEMLDADDLNYNLEDPAYEQSLEAESDSMLLQMDRELDRSMQSGQNNPTTPPPSR